MKSKIPDNVVYSDETGYNANALAYPTNVGAPAIKIDDIIFIILLLCRKHKIFSIVGRSSKI